MRIAVVGPLSPRLAHAVEGLRARGHAVSSEATGNTVVDIVVGERPIASAWRAVQGHARAMVLGLSAQEHSRWNAFERWVWAVMGGYGLIVEHEVGGFLARVPEEEQERLALWPESHGAEAIVSPDTDVLERLCERAIARRTAGPGRSALFVDRDGTMIVEKHHLGDPDQVELLPGVPEALRIRASTTRRMPAAASPRACRNAPTMVSPARRLMTGSSVASGATRSTASTNRRRPSLVSMLARG